MQQNQSGFQEDFVTIKKQWGYFSKKDGYTHSFVLCEECYDKITAEFKKEVEVIETTELL